MEAIVNRKRIFGIICLILIIGLMISPVIYADTNDDIDANAGAQRAGELKITQTYPENNDNKLQTNNTGIKLFFDGNVIDKNVWKNNSKCFKLTTKKGKEIKTKAYSSAKSGTDYILVVVDQGVALKPNSDYYFTVSQGVQSKDGKVLPKDVVLHYKTVDTQGNSRVNMALMGVMVVGMIVMTVVSNKRKVSKETKKKEDKVNPYKVAKEKGKSVEEVVEKMEKDKARKAKKLKGKSDDKASAEEDDVQIFSKMNLRKVADGGSTYKTGRKAEAEKKAKAEAAKKAKGTTNPKKGKKKGKKKK